MSIENRKSHNIVVIDLTADEDDQSSNVIIANDRLPSSLQLIGADENATSPDSSEILTCRDLIQRPKLEEICRTLSYTPPISVSAESLEENQNLRLFRHGFHDEFQQILEYPEFRHDCSEEHIVAILEKTTLAANSIVRIWDEFASLSVPSCATGTNFIIPSHKHKWNTISIPDNLFGKRQRLKHFAPWPIDKLQTAILTQKLACYVRLPVPAYPNWCQANSLDHLNTLINNAKKMKRMIVVVCSKQNTTFWEPQLFHKWAPQYPRLCFASIDRDIANSGWDRSLCRKLLGFDHIDGVSFVSHVDGEPCRAFNGNRSSTDDISTSLLTRYTVAKASGAIPAFEKDGMSSKLEVHLMNAFSMCMRKVRHCPLSYEFSFRMVDTRSIEGRIAHQLEASTAVPGGSGTVQCDSGEDSEFVPVGGFVVPTNSLPGQTDTPRLFLLPLLPEQAQSVNWMRFREKETLSFTGVSRHDATIDVPPLQNISLQWRLRLRYSVRGGVLCDSIGFGKTACVLALVALTRDDPIPMSQSPRSALISTGATLVVVPSHLVTEWASETRKFLGSACKVITILTVDDMPTVTAVKRADLVIVSVNIFLSKVYVHSYIQTSPEIDPRTSNARSRTVRDIAYLNSLSQRLGEGIVCDWLPELESKEPDTGSAATQSKPRKRARTSQTIPQMISSSYTTTTTPKLIIDRPSAKLPLEAFFWRRLVIDEVHELAQAELDEGSATWTLPVRCLVAHSRWGLTGTPPVYDMEGIQCLGGVMGVHIGEKSASSAADFVSKFMMSNRRREAAHPPPVERWVYFKMTTEERVLYRQAKYELAEEKHGKDPTLAMQKLLQQCTCFTLGTARGAATTPGEEMSLAIERREQSLKKKVEKKAELDAKYERALSQLRSLDEDMSMPEALRQSRRAVCISNKEELLDERRKLESEIDVIQRHVNFFRETVARMADASNLSECVICLEPMTIDLDATITVCGHMQCLSCLRCLFDTHMKNGNINCPTCRQLVSESDWKLLESSDVIEELNTPLRGNNDSNTDDSLVKIVSKIKPGFDAWGSKIGFIATQIHDVLASENNAKILVYCQWDILKHKLLAAFKECNFKCEPLQGNPDQMRQILARFKDVNNGINVLLCSLELKASGLNLQMANHIVLVHPFLAKGGNKYQAAAWEAQAIGRVLRPGQKKRVNIWRFVALETVEQELLVKENFDIMWQSHFGKESSVKVDEHSAI